MEILIETVTISITPRGKVLARVRTMSTRDSGVIDLFAIHKEEEQRVIASPASSAPPVSLDVDASDVDPELFAAAQQKSRRTKMIGGVLGGIAVLGILVAAITTSGSKEAPAAAAAAAPPPAAVVPPPPVVAAPTPPPPSTAKAPGEKADYTPASAAAAYASTQKKKGHGKAKVGAGVKMQKVQSGGVN